VYVIKVGLSCTDVVRMKSLSRGIRKEISCCHYSKWFEPRSISSSSVVIVRVRVVLKRTVVGDRRFDNLSGSHLQSQVNSVCQSMML